MPKPESNVGVHFECHKHGEVHVLCVPVPRPVPPQIACDPDTPRGYGSGGGDPCLPTDLVDRVMAALEHGLGQWVRLGYVEIGT